MEVQGSLALVGRALEAAEHALQVSLQDPHPSPCPQCGVGGVGVSLWISVGA